MRCTFVGFDGCLVGSAGDALWGYCGGFGGLMGVSVIY
jgi:hypothetical protein